MIKDQMDKKKILIVEDERAYSRALELKLSKNGFEVESVQDGLSALSVLKEKKIDLLITDLIMPKMNGFELLEELSKNNIKIETIVLSNLTQEEDKKKAERWGVEIFLEKSNITISEIIETVSSIFKK
jgi:DNA-binding response OmpR family regulator